MGDNNGDLGQSLLSPRRAPLSFLSKASRPPPPPVSVGLRSKAQFVAPTVQAMSAEEAAFNPITWQELRGFKTTADPDSENNWHRLLPEAKLERLLNEQLRRQLVKFGELEQTLTDGFDNEKQDPGYGTPWFAAEDLLNNVLPYSSEVRDKYQVVQYIAGNAGIFNIGLHHALNMEDRVDKSRVMGFVALGPAECGEPGTVDLTFAWRGTMTKSEYVSDVFGDQMVFWDNIGSWGWWGKVWNKKPGSIPEEPMMHRGWRMMYCHSLPADETGRKFPSPQKTVHESLESILKAYNVKTVTTTGHSMGGVFATISSFDIGSYLALYDPSWCKAHGVEPKPWPQDWATKEPPLVTCYSYGSPRVGDIFFRKRFEGLPHLRLLRISNIRDMVTQIPGLTETCWSCWPCVSYFRPPFTTGNDPGCDFDRSTALGEVMDPLKWAGAWACSLLFCFNTCYFHVGPRLTLDSLASKVLAPLGLLKVGERHSMEVHIWMILHQHAKPEVKEPETIEEAKKHGLRDIRLVNKREGPLKEKYKVPVAWWINEPEPPRVPIVYPDWAE